MTQIPHSREAGNSPASLIHALRVSYVSKPSGGTRPLWQAVTRSGWSPCAFHGHDGHISPEAARYCFLRHLSAS